jgi:hypothetical protein
VNDSRPLALMMVGVVFGALLGFALFERGISTNFISTVTLLATVCGIVGFGVGALIVKRRPQVSHSAEALSRLGMGIMMLITWVFLYGYYGLPALFRGNFPRQLLIDPALYALITLSFFASLFSTKLMRVLGVLIVAVLLAAFFAGEDSSKLAFQLFVGIGFSIWCFRDRKIKKPPDKERAPSTAEMPY